MLIYVIFTDIYLYLTKFYFSKYSVTGILYNFAVTMMKLRHKAPSFLMLAVIISMQLVNVFHIHEPQEVIENVVCDMCSHHVHHPEHIISDGYHMHPCLMCQVCSNQYVTPQVLHLSCAQLQITRLDNQPLIALPVTTIIHRQSRAPPVI